jgi:Tfp pilus assembly protein PilF
LSDATDLLIAAAAACQQRGDYSGAESRYITALSAAPDDIRLWKALAVIYIICGRATAAEWCARKALVLRPDDVAARTNLSNMLSVAERYDEAKAEIDRALYLAPHDHNALHAAGRTAFNRGDLPASIRWFEKALREAPNDQHKAISADFAYPMLASGDLQRGFALYENRWVKVAKSQVWDLGIPLWNRGERVEGKRLLIHSDQGFGDVLQFCRFIPQLREMGAEVVLAVPGELLRFMAYQRLADEVVHIGRQLPPCDVHVGISSLPHRLNLRLDQVRGAPYLAAPPLSRSLPVHPGIWLRVGLVWGARYTLHTIQRSIPLTSLLSLALLNGVQLFSLQVGEHAEELAAAGPIVTDLTADISDFHDTASLMAQLDLIISVDSAPLHLAAGLGRPTIGLIPAAGCWRFLRGRDDSPWYDTLRLIRQEKPRDWTHAVAQLIESVAAAAA